MTEPVYSTPEWADARAAALVRDGSRCTLARLVGGPCHPMLDVHHLVPVSDGGDPYCLDNLVTVCHSHHPMLEGLRRWLTRRQGWKRCHHHHPYPGGRAACERRLNAAA